MVSTRETLRRHGLGVIAVLGLVLACPSLGATPGCAARARHAEVSIPAQRLANWEPVDDRTLLIWTVHDSRAHLLELDHPVPGLRAAPTIFLITRNHDPNVHACADDQVMIPGGETARIISIRYLSQKRTAQLDPAEIGATRARMTFT